jgi:DegV family protein with EDD domain
VVTDSAADVPFDELDRLDIHVVPLRVHFGDRSYLDKVGMTAEEFYEELARNPLHPKTSQPPMGDFRRQFEFLGSHFDSVVSIHLSRQVSGTCASAEAAAARVTTHGKVAVIDSMNASLGLGLVAMYAAECAQAGYDAARVLEATRAIIPRTHTFGLIGSLEYAVRGGRVPRWVKNVADSLQLMPVLQNDRKGRVTAGGALFGRQHLKEKFARYVRRRMRDDVPCRLLVGHANCEADGQWLLDELTTGNVVYRRLLPCGTAFGVHGGPGLLVAAIQEYERPP